MNVRAIKILNYLISTGSTTVKELSEKFSTTSRTIYYDLEEINCELQKNRLSKLNKNKKNYSILPEEEKEVKELIDNKLTFSAEERKIYILLKLFYKGEINLNEEVNILQIKKRAIEDDLEEIRKFLIDEPIEIVHVSKERIILDGNEISIRGVFSAILFLPLSKRETLRSVLKELVDEIYQKYNGDKMLKLIYELSKHYQMKSSSYFIFHFLSSLFIIQIRLEKNKKLLLDSQLDELSTTNSFLNPDKGKEYLIDMLEKSKEFTFIKEVLKKYRVKADDLGKMALAANITRSSMISEERKDLNYADTIRFAEEFKKYNDIDIWDHKLLDSITSKLQRRIVKFGYKFLAENKKYKVEIPERMSPIYNIVKKVCEENFGQIIDTEIAMVTLLISNKIDEYRSKQERPKKILVGDFALGNDILNDIMNKILLLFNIEIVNIISVYNIKKYIKDDEEKIDYIFIFEEDYHDQLKNISIPILKLNAFSFGETYNLLFENGFIKIK